MHRLFFERPLGLYTLTYGKDFPTVPDANLQFRNWVKRVRDRIPHFAAIWVSEFQKRGALHFHLIGLVVDSADIEFMGEQWLRISGWNRSSKTARERYGFDMRAYERASYGVAMQRYLSKCLVNEASKWNQQIECEFRGRTWGKLNKKVLEPFRQDLKEVEFNEQTVGDKLREHILEGWRKGFIKAYECVDGTDQVEIRVIPVRLWYFDHFGSWVAKQSEIVRLSKVPAKRVQSDPF